MKINVFIFFTAFFLVTLMGCKQKEEVERPPLPSPSIDEPLPNDADDPNRIVLYNKPLQVIQSSIVGKWKVGISFGGFVGILFPVNYYITIDEKAFDANFSTAHGKSTFDYEWRFLKTYDDYETYVMWDKQNEIDAEKSPELYIPNGYVFHYLLHNDTLVVSNYARPSFSDILIRVKE